jgi:hypothetical protein
MTAVNAPFPPFRASVDQDEVTTTRGRLADVWEPLYPEATPPHCFTMAALSETSKTIDSY